MNKKNQKFKYKQTKEITQTQKRVHYTGAQVSGVEPCFCFEGSTYLYLINHMAL